ncbi:16S rRNA (guanine(527)-N(7))-methyltransferase RsmG [bacterium]|nr:16S rRNA (guanine(527)-N(7))-methyltransferase RsmG [bacterium]
MTAPRNIDSYKTLLFEYNNHTNIYSKSAYPQLDFHIQDSLTIAKLFTATPKRLLDIGSGSGLPSLPLAIENPEIEITAVESKSRKCRFLNQVKSELNLKNYTVINDDIHHYISTTRPRCDVITAKAFAPLPRLIKTLEMLKYTAATAYIPISENQENTLILTQLPKFVSEAKIIVRDIHRYLSIKLQ